MPEGGKTAAAAATVVGVREFRENLADYLRRAREGASFVVTSHGEPVARLLPPEAATSAREPRRLGWMRGRIELAPDFDETPEDIIDAMLNGDIEPR